MDALAAAAAAAAESSGKSIGASSQGKSRRKRGGTGGAPTPKRSRAGGASTPSRGTPGGARGARRTPPSAGRKSPGGRYDSSLTLLTKRFTELITSSPDGIVDLNEAALTLGVQKRRIYDITNVLEGIRLITKRSKNQIQWHGAGSSNGEGDSGAAEALRHQIEELRRADAELDETIAKQQAVLKALTQDPEAAKLAYITHDDLRSLECFESKTVIAIKAPDGTNLEVPDPDEGLEAGFRRYQIWISSDKGPIEVFLVPKSSGDGVSEDDADGGVSASSMPQPDASGIVPVVPGPSVAIGSEEFNRRVEALGAVEETEDEGGILAQAYGDADQVAARAAGAGAGGGGDAGDRDDRSLAGAGVGARGGRPRSGSLIRVDLSPHAELGMLPEHTTAMGAGVGINDLFGDAEVEGDAYDGMLMGGSRPRAASLGAISESGESSSGAVGGAARSAANAGGGLWTPTKRTGRDGDDDGDSHMAVVGHGHSGALASPLPGTSLALRLPENVL